MDLTKWWIQTHEAPSSAEKMWESWQADHRLHLVDALKTLPPLDSVYEIGCGSGPNLRLLRERYPRELTLGGSEPSPGMAAWASEHLAIRVDNVALPQVPTDPWDCVLSCYAMAYLEPQDLQTTLENLHDCTSLLVVFEPNAQLLPYDAPNLYSLGGAVPCWAHDYPTELRKAGWQMIWRWPYMPHKDGLNAVIVAEQEPQ